MDHDDNVIRANDIPERMQLATSSLSSSSTLTLPSEFPVSELDAASYWVSLRISPRTEHEIFRPDGKYHEHLEAFSAAVSDALHSILCKNHEVPYIWTHRRDNLSVFTPGGNPPRIELLSRTELWRVGVLGARYRALYERKETLRQTYERMGVEDKYYEGDIIDQVDSVEVVTDVMDWLCMKYPDRHRDALEVVEAGRQQKKPNRVSAYERVKATPISKLAIVRSSSFYAFCKVLVNSGIHPVIRYRRPRHCAECDTQSKRALHRRSGITPLRNGGAVPCSWVRKGDGYSPERSNARRYRTRA